MVIFYTSNFEINFNQSIYCDEQIVLHEVFFQRENYMLINEINMSLAQVSTSTSNVPFIMISCT